jgi:hypothetical protein
MTSKWLRRFKCDKHHPEYELPHSVHYPHDSVDNSAACEEASLDWKVALAQAILEAQKKPVVVPKEVFS